MSCCRHRPSAQLLATALAGSLLHSAVAALAAPERPWRGKPRLRGGTALRGAFSNKPTPSGLEFVLSGYDIYKGNPSPTRGSVDPGFQHPIFDAQFKTDAGTVDGKQQLPDGMTSLSCDGSCSLEAQIQSIYGASSYSRALSARVSLDASIFGARFGASFDFQRIANGTSAKASVYTQAEATCCFYKVELASFKPPPPSPDFLAAVQGAPAEYDSDYYLSIIQEFGTHYVSSAEMGGVYGQQTSFTRERYAEMTSSSFDWSAYARASFVVSLTAQAGSTRDRNKSKMFDNWGYTRTAYSLGKRPPASGKWQDWLKDDLGTPAPVHTDLRPISDLFAERFYPGTAVSGLDAKRANMERALKEYCPQHLLPQGLIHSCEPPSADSGLPEPFQTCLGRVEARGGSGGSPFDDGAENISQNGLFSNLQVSKLDYMAADFVDSLQLVLVQGDQSWFLQRHGTFGRAESWSLDPGTTVTGVEVRWCNYVDSLTFYTSDGNEVKIGGPGGCHTSMVNFKEEVHRQFNITAHRAWLVGFLGRTDKWIDSVGFYFAYEAQSCPDISGSR